VRLLIDENLGKFNDGHKSSCINGLKNGNQKTTNGHWLPVNKELFQ
jgi:hypothetical protein